MDSSKRSSDMSPPEEVIYRECGDAIVKSRRREGWEASRAEVVPTSLWRSELRLGRVIV